MSINYTLERKHIFYCSGMFSEKMNSLAWHCQEEIRIEFCEEMAWELATSKIEM